MVGTLEVHAYIILPNEEIIRDTRLVIVTPADDLQVSVAADKAQYRPGDDAVLTFSVTDQQQHPILAALGVAIVDESVFALSELQPGLEKVYFTLEKELMEPKYEIHGLTPSDLVLARPMPARPVPLEVERQRAAAMLLAAVPTGKDFDFRVDTYQQRWEELKAKVTAEMQSEHAKIVAALTKYNREHNTSLDAQQGLFRLVALGYLTQDDLKDHWGHYYKTNLSGAQPYLNNWFTLSSAGPDGQWGTADDIIGIGEPILDFNPGFNNNNFIMAAGDAVALQGDLRNGPMVQTAALAVHAAPVALSKAGAEGMNRPTASVMTAVNGDEQTAAAADEPRVRDFFPETMYWNPAIITDARGQAQLRVPMADSITSWRMSMTANSARRATGQRRCPAARLPGLLRRYRPARLAHPARPCGYPRLGLQLSARRAAGDADAGASRLVHAGRLGGADGAYGQR